eukprot:Gb_37727 [translate_table: standard]
MAWSGLLRRAFSRSSLARLQLAPIPPPRHLQVATSIDAHTVVREVGGSNGANSLPPISPFSFKDPFSFESHTLQPDYQGVLFVVVLEIMNRALADMQSLKQIVQSHFLVYDRLLYQWMLVVLAIWIGGRYLMRRLYGKLGTRGPKSWPLIGSSLELIANINNRYEWTTQYAKRFPTFEANFYFKKLVFTVDPVVEHILKTNFSNYIKGPGAYEINYDLLGDGIFNSDGEMWKIQRKTASLEFSSKILRDYSTNAFRKWGLKLASILQHEAHNMQPVNMQDMFMRMTFDSICEVGFGVEICSLSPSLPNVPFASAFDSCNSIIASRYGDPLWKFKKLFNIGMEAKLKEDLSVIDGFIYGIIQRRREAMKNNTEIKPDLLSRILSLGMENPNTYSDKYLRDAILSFIIAGRDTTAVTLSWFMFLLSKNPKPGKPGSGHSNFFSEFLQLRFTRQP